MSNPFVKGLASEFASAINFKLLIALAYNPDLRLKLEEEAAKASQAAPQVAKQGAHIASAAPTPAQFQAIEQSDVKSILTFLKSEPVASLFTEESEREDYLARIGSVSDRTGIQVGQATINSFSDYLAYGLGGQDNEFLKLLTKSLNELATKNPERLKLFLSSFIPMQEGWKGNDGLMCAGGSVSVLQSQFASVTSAGYVFPKILSAVSGIEAQISYGVREINQKHVPALIKLITASIRDPDPYTLSPLDTANRVKLFTELDSLPDRFALELEEDFAKLWERVGGLIPAEPALIAQEVLFSHLSKESASEAEKNLYPDLIDFLGADQLKFIINQTLYTDPKGEILTDPRKFTNEVAQELCANLASAALGKLAEVYAVRKSDSATVDPEFALVQGSGKFDLSKIRKPGASDPAKSSREKIEASHASKLARFRTPGNTADMLGYLLKKYPEYHAEGPVLPGEEKSPEDVASFLCYLYSIAEITGHDPKLAHLRGPGYYDLAKAWPGEFTPQMIHALKQVAKDLPFPSEEYNSRLRQFLTPQTDLAPSDQPYLAQATIQKLEDLFSTKEANLRQIKFEQIRRILNDPDKTKAISDVGKEDMRWLLSYFVLEATAGRAGPNDNTRQDAVEAAKAIMAHDPSLAFANFIDYANSTGLGGSKCLSPWEIATLYSGKDPSLESPGNQLIGVMLDGLLKQENSFDKLFELGRTGELPVVLRAINERDPKQLQQILTNKNSEGETLIQAAVSRGKTQVLKAVLETAKLYPEILAQIDSTKLLHSAIEQGDSAMVAELIDGVDVNQPDEQELTLLDRAANSWNSKVLELLLEKTELNPAKASAMLYDAVRKGNSSTVEVLIKIVKPDVDEASKLLRSAVDNNQVWVIEELIKAGADINRPNGQEPTPLDIAMAKGNAMMLENLIKGRTELDLDKASHMLEIAVKEGHEGLARELMKVVGLDVRSKPGVLYEAGHEERARERMRVAGLDVRSKPHLLYSAAEKGHAGVVEALIKAGADVNRPNAQGLTPFDIAAQNNHAEGLKHLIGAGAQPRNTDVGALFQQALASGNAGMIRVLAQMPRANTNSYEQEITTSFYGAVKKGNTDLVVALIRVGANTQRTDASGHTPLDIAIQNGRTEVVKILVGASPEAMAKALHKAVESQQSSVVEGLLQELLEDNIDRVLNQPDANGNTLLHIAASNGDGYTLGHLIKAGADVNHRDGSGRTPLDIAAEGGYAASTARLIEAGARLDPAKAPDLLLKAVEGGKKDMVRMLAQVLPRARVNEIVRSFSDGGTDLLQIAVKKGHLDVAAELIKAGADASSIVQELSAMVRSAPDSWEAKKRIKFLTEALPKDKVSEILNQPDADGTTLLHIAAKKWGSGVVKQLAEAGADPEQADGGRTLLTMAIEGGEVSTVIALAEVIAAKGKEAKEAKDILNERDAEGTTLLHIAAEKGRAHVVAELIEAGAIPQNDKKGRTPFGLAAKNGHIAVLQKLIKADPTLIKKASVLLYKAAERGDEKTAKTLLEIGANANVVNKKKLSTPLSIAVQNEHVGVVSKLIKAGADLSQSTDKISALIHKAIQDKDSLRDLRDLIRVLGTKDKATAAAILNNPGPDGETILSYAIKNDLLGIVPDLIGAGADVNQADKDGRTPLRIAAQKGSKNIDAVIYLLRTGANVDHAKDEIFILLCNAAELGDGNAIRGLVRELKGKASEILNHLDTNGNTILHITEHTYVVEALIESGADASIRNAKGQTPLDVAAEKKNTWAVDILARAMLETGQPESRHQPVSKFPLFVAASEGRVDIVRALIEAGGEKVNQATQQKKLTPLHFAVLGGHLEMVKFLVAAGADMDKASKDGSTPLGIATTQGKGEIVEFLNQVKEARAQEAQPAVEPEQSEPAALASAGPSKLTTRLRAALRAHDDSPTQPAPTPNHDRADQVAVPGRSPRTTTHEAVLGRPSTSPNAPTLGSATFPGVRVGAMRPRRGPQVPPIDDGSRT